MERRCWRNLFGRMLLHTLSLMLLSLPLGVLSNEGVITELRVSSRIEQRYAQTMVTSTMKNTNSHPSELKFKMTLPKAAFISSFIMEIEGRNYTSTVKEKEAARKTYDRARQRGKTTGLVEQRDDSIQKFEVSTNVAAEGKVTFYLRYEELLHRVKGRYLYTVKVSPGHAVPAVSIDVHIIENEPIKDLKLMELPGKENVEDDYGNYVSEYRPRPGEVQLSYRLEDMSGNLDGSFSLSYDINMQPDGGEVQVVGNYFVHHFSPEGLPKMPVHSVFVLDISSSMSDGKLIQLKEAMEAILNDLQPEDSFELIAFGSTVQHLGTFSSRKKDLKKAVKMVKRLSVSGATNLYDAYMESVRSITAFNGTKIARQVVFLTDGIATVGVTNKQSIRRDVREANTHQYPIFGLAFGDDSDFDLLNKISTDNKAFARKIAFNEAARDQLKGFYEEISTPLMTEVDIDYNEYEVDTNTIVQQGISTFYTGREVVLAGQVAEGVTEVRPIVKGIGKEGPLQFRVQRLDSRSSDSITERENFVGRLWAYLMVQDLLGQAALSEDANQIENLKKEATEIALRFNFVTKLTSLVVVRPEDDDEATISDEAIMSDDVSTQKRQFDHGRRLASPRMNIDRMQIQRNAKQAILLSLPRVSSTRQYVDNDPHFVVSAPGVPLPLCFDLHGQHGAVLSLIKDPDSGITVNGQVTAADGRPSKTYFTSLFIAIDQLTLEISPESIKLHCPHNTDVITSLWPMYRKNGKVFKSGKSHGRRRKGAKKAMNNRRKRRSADTCDQYTTWASAAGKRFGDVTLLLRKKRKLHIHVGDGDAHFVVLRSKNKHGQSFLGFYLQQERIFSSNTTGIIGQFAVKNVTITSPTYDNDGSINVNNSNGTLMTASVYRWNHHKQYEMSEVSGFLAHRRSLLDKVHVRCLHIRNGGQGLLDGHPQDYIIPCLSC